jgi:hypothetical protein
VTTMTPVSLILLVVAFVCFASASSRVRAHTCPQYPVIIYS